MDFVKINNRGSARIFRSSFLESLTKTRPWVIYSIYIPLCSWMLYHARTKLGIPLLSLCLIFFIAMFSWTLVEYLVHRYLFHYHPTTKFGERVVYIFHGTHHEYPRDKIRLFMPPVPSLIFACLVWLVFFSLSFIFAGTGHYAFVIFPGFVIGYLIYVSMHYAIHAYPPPKFMKALWRNHHLHHYKYPDKGFGVSSSFWDLVFGTMPDNQKKAKTQD